LSATSETEVPEHRNPSYQVFILTLCVYALAIQAAEVFFHPSPATREILNDADHVLCALFFIDFLASLIRSQNRRRYLLTWGWIDLLSSIPMIPVLRWGRVARVTRVFRVLRGIRATRVLASFLLQRRRDSALLSMLLIAMLLVVSASIMVLHLESTAETGIHTASDALWWSVGSITPGGHINVSPATHSGRLLGIMLMIAGAALFGVFAGYIASWFLAPGEREQTTEMAEIQTELAALRCAVEELARQRTTRG
jgi:voltage-gated potassium channel